MPVATPVAVAALTGGPAGVGDEEGAKEVAVHATSRLTDTIDALIRNVVFTGISS